jgi:hypothetical protein
LPPQFRPKLVGLLELDKELKVNRLTIVLFQLAILAAMILFGALTYFAKYL